MSPLSTEIELVAMANEVTTSVASPAVADARGRARDAARALVGVAGWISRAKSLSAMQKAMGDLAAYAPAWDPAAPLRALPVVHGRVDEAVVALAAVSSSLVPFFGAKSLRCAMAFWAVESDPAVWQTVAAA